MAPNPAKRRRTSQTEVRDAAAGASLPGDAPVVVFAHGAGAPSTSEWMVRWKDKLDEILGAVAVLTFDYPYFSGGKRKAPPKAEKLVDHHLNVVKDAVEKYHGHPLVLVGKSMGSRVSCMVASSGDAKVSAIVCLGYPLKGTNGVIRDETLLQLAVPTLFVQGSKDPLCPLDKLETTRKKMKCVNKLHVVDGGDHSLKVGKKFQEASGLDQEGAETKALKAIAEFIHASIDGK